MLKKLIRLVNKHPIITIAIVIALTSIFFYGLAKVSIVTDVEKMLPEGDPRVTTFNEVDETFGGGRICYGCS